MHIGIVGLGVVGRALYRMINDARSHTMVIYDKYLDSYRSPEQLCALNGCDLVFVAVPTPFDAAQNTCDVSIVTQTISMVSAPLCIKSTIPPGTTNRLRASTGKKIGFSPEYLGETVGHPWTEAYHCGFVILSGDEDVCKATQAVYETSAPTSLQFVRSDSTTAELAKYMENCFLATKVAFMNQFFDLATSAGIDFAELTRLFLLDKRIGTSHTVVMPDRGFDGKCLPKDLQTIISWAGNRADAQLLEAVVRYNGFVRSGGSR